MANIKIEYAVSSALTKTLSALPTSATLLAGWETNEVDNTTNKYLDYLLAGKITTGTTPTDVREIRVYVVGLMEDSTYPGVFDGTSSAETVSSVLVRNAVCKLAANIGTNNTSDFTYWFGPISVAALFGGVMPKKFVVFVTHNTGVNLHATEGNHAFWITPVFETV